MSSNDERSQPGAVGDQEDVADSTSPIDPTLTDGTLQQTDGPSLENSVDSEQPVVAANDSSDETPLTGESDLEDERMPGSSLPPTTTAPDVEVGWTAEGNAEDGDSNRELKANGTPKSTFYTADKRFGTLEVAGTRFPIIVKHHDPVPTGLTDAKLRAKWKYWSTLSRTSKDTADRLLPLTKDKDDRRRVSAKTASFLFTPEGNPCRVTGWNQFRDFRYRHRGDMGITVRDNIPPGPTQLALLKDRQLRKDHKALQNLSQADREAVAAGTKRKAGTSYKTSATGAGRTKRSKRNTRSATSSFPISRQSATATAPTNIRLYLRPAAGPVQVPTLTGAPQPPALASPATAPAPPTAAAPAPDGSRREGATQFSVPDLRNNFQALVSDLPVNQERNVNAEQLARVVNQSVRGATSAARRRHLRDLAVQLEKLAEEDEEKYGGSEDDGPIGDADGDDI